VKNPRLIPTLLVAGSLLACSSSESDWSKAQATIAEPASQGSAQKHGAGSKEDQARAQLQKPQSEGYRIQFGIFPEQQDAEKLHDSLESRLGGELQGTVVIPPSDSESSYRVASRPMTAEGAEAACAKLIEDHLRCAVVKR
jgi:hypothetical protein